MRSVSELVEEGARVIADGLLDYMPMADLGRAVGRVQLQIHLQMKNRQGLPDLRAMSDSAKDANRHMFEQAKELADIPDDVMTKIIRAVHNHKADVRAEYLRSLDEPGADLSPYTSILQDGSAPSLSVAAMYGVNVQGRRDRNREQARRERAMRVTNGAPSDRAYSVVTALVAVLGESDPEDFRYLGGARKRSAQRELKGVAKKVAELSKVIS